MSSSPERLSKGFYQEKGSKFYGFLFPIQKREEVEKLIEQVAIEYPDSRHNCYAWRIGIEKTEEFANDAGEPKHSAGDPILNQLRSAGLVNSLAVVARIYGGTKLGVPGLRAAYSEASQDAVKNATLIPAIEYSRLRIIAPFQHQGLIENLLRDPDVKVLSREFSEEANYDIQVQRSSFDELSEKLKGMAHLGIKIKAVS